MWIVLLDCSGSMGEPFSGAGGFAGRARYTTAETRLQAARVALREHVATVQDSDRIAVLAFTSTTRTIFVGTASQRSQLNQALEALSAHNGTDVAAALTAVKPFLQGAPHELVRILVISDGLDDADRAYQAAMSLVTGHLVLIDVILIDPTEKGEALARRIALRGSVTAVVGGRQLAQEVGRTAEARRALAAVVEAEAQRTEAAYRRIVDDRGSDPAAFTGAWAEHMAPGIWHPLLVYVHRPDLLGEVKRRVGHQAALRHTALEPVRGSGSRRLPRGTLLRVRPHGSGMEFNPPELSVGWLEGLHELSFRARPGAAAAERGLADIAFDVLAVEETTGTELLIGTIRGSTAVSAVPPGPPKLISTTSTMVDRVFASYSRADEDVVRRLAQAYEALGIFVFIDTDDIRSGEAWEQLIPGYIDEADAFQLFWSEEARASKNVEREWTHAMSRIPPKDLRFIRPVYWADSCPEIPVALRDINFARIRLAREEQPVHAGPAGGTSTVIPLLAGIDPSDVRRIEHLTALALESIAEATGLKPAAVPTLLVDEQVVAAVRQVTVVDAAQSPQSPRDLDVERAEAIIDIAQAIGLAFHTHMFLDPQLGWEERLPVTAERTQRTLERVQALNNVSEWLIRATGTTALGTGQWSEERTRDALLPLARTGVPGVGPDRPPAQRLAALLIELSQVVGHLWQWAPPESTECGYSVSVRSVQRLLQELDEAGLGWSGPETSFMNRTPMVKLRGTPDAFAQALAMCTREWLCLFGLDNVGQERLTQLALEVPTYGIYIPVGATHAERQLRAWATEKGIPLRFTLPDRPRVLLCLGAIARWTQQLDPADGDRPSRERVASRLLRSVLAHEHFHATLDATPPAPGSETSSPAGSGSDLEEALAGWLQRWDCIGEPAAEATVDAWIDHGSYPAWPYAGARHIGPIARGAELDAFRAWLERLRLEPARAARALDGGND